MSAEINWSYGETDTVSANTTDEDNIVQVTSTKKLTLKRVTVHFPSGVNYQLRLQVFRGADQVVPDSGYLTGDDSVVVVECNVTFIGGEYIKLKRTNTDTTNSHSYYILLEGVLE